jgi:hypothetical protein
VLLKVAAACSSSSRAVPAEPPTRPLWPRAAVEKLGSDALLPLRDADDTLHLAAGGGQFGASMNCTASSDCGMWAGC